MPERPTIHRVRGEIREPSPDGKSPHPDAEPLSVPRRTRIWCGNCGCNLYYTPGATGCAYECRVCGWRGDAY